MPSLKANLLVCGLVFSACQGVVPSGHVVTTTRVVPAFHQLSIASGIEATASNGPRELTIRADDNLQSFIETLVENDTLIVRLKPTTLVGSPRTMEAVISSDALEGLDASGGVHVTMTATPVIAFPLSASGGSVVSVSGLSSTTFSVDASGGSGVTITGEATRASVTASGGSHLVLTGVPLESLTVSASGGSSVTARVSGTLTGSASGGSTILIVGTPASTLDTSGGSQLHLGAQ